MKSKQVRMSAEAIKYFKDDESLTINVEKRGQDLAVNTRELDSSVDGSSSSGRDHHVAAASGGDSNGDETVERVETFALGIAPKHIREYEIKKPDEKEPSLIKMISNKIKGNRTNSVSEDTSSGGVGAATYVSPNDKKSSRNNERLNEANTNN